MNRREGVLFLFTTIKEIERSFERPVILFTLKDYADDVFNVLLEIREALINHALPESISEIVTLSHLQWLEAIQEVENFKKRAKETPPDAILKAIDFTMQCTQTRYKNLQIYIDRIQPVMTKEETQLIKTDMKVIKGMQDNLNSALLEKQKYIRSLADKTEYNTKINDEIEELMYWLDGLYNSLVIQFCKTIDIKFAVAPSDLTNILQQIIDEVAADSSPEAQKVADVINTKGKLLGSVIRISSLNELEIAKVVKKVKELENRISRLQNEKSSALMALQHKTLYLEERLLSLENLKETMNILKNESKYGTQENICDYKRYQIFNHLLPHNDRCRLVDQLVHLWNSAITKQDHESIISILSIADLKESYSDDKGKFSVDKYGRKIYTQGNDNILYQLNERNELVPVNDDEKHVYFFDEYGRYYVNEKSERVYKDHEGASEYILSTCGYLIKVLDKVEGTDYFYDWLGRYYINDEGKRIYVEENSSDEYEHDGFGNLVKINSDKFRSETFKPEPMTMEESKYLKREVGEALKKCIADVVLHQPNDPVAYLAECLMQFGKYIKKREKHIKNEKERIEERELFLPIQKNSPVCSYTVDESNTDYNFHNYKHSLDDSF